MVTLILIVGCNRRTRIRIERWWTWHFFANYKTIEKGTAVFVPPEHLVCVHTTGEWSNCSSYY